MSFTMLRSNMKKILDASWQFLISPQARRFEVALAVGLYEAVRAALGHA